MTGKSALKRESLKSEVLRSFNTNKRAKNQAEVNYKKNLSLTLNQLCNTNTYLFSLGYIAHLYKQVKANTSASLLLAHTRLERLSCFKLNIPQTFHKRFLNHFKSKRL